MNQKTHSIIGLLADTWWFGMSQRLSESSFQDLARLRVDQGFNAIQLIVGIPPEVGPDNPQGFSDAGPAWALDGRINADYLELAKQRVRQLNTMGLRVIVYGAWGHQIDWAGTAFMQQWWQYLIAALDDLDVIYCLCGEVGLWVGQADQLLPDRSTDDVIRAASLETPRKKTFSLGKKISNSYFWRVKMPKLSQQRLQNWSEVLQSISSLTSRPILLHVNSGQQSRKLLPAGSLLAANSTQTGHREASRRDLWQLPRNYLQAHPDDYFINLEPWYEGIRDCFYAEDQLFAYWVSMLAGCCSYCYGAQGIWNIGDGEFMSHWGTQTFTTATQLEGAALIGQSHAFFMSCWKPGRGQTRIRENSGSLEAITRYTDNRYITYIPAVEFLPDLPEGEIWLPLEARLTTDRPEKGPVVIVTMS